MNIADIFGDLPVLGTKRLILRKMRLDDAHDVFEYASDPEVANYVTWDAHENIEDSRRFLQSIIQHYENKEVASWGVVFRDNNKFIGTCGFMWWLPGDARAEIGYAMSRQYWGKGLMTEAVREVISFGFERMMLNRIEAQCMAQNIGSERVMQKNGMTIEGIRREATFRKGAYHDLKIYSILKKEYDL